ncbi:hypothetical protein OH415_27430, partial [Salmonella enterica]|nr:hypothetical protein [Salmonella enterica]
MRISLTSACNYACTYCVPNGKRLVAAQDELSAEAMARGVAYQMTGSRTAYIGDSYAWLSNPVAFGISPSFIIALLVIIA